MLKNLNITESEIKSNVTVWVTMHSDGTKMDGIQSISTAVTCNRFCAARRANGESVCAKCYAETLCKMRKKLREHITDNSRILNERLLTEDECRKIRIVTRIARIESFGDVTSVLQARNYIRIIRAIPNTQFGIWSKNWNFWKQAFKIEGKPNNCTFVLSSLRLNEPAKIPKSMRDYIDHVFTVYDPKHYVYENTPQGCAGIQCRSCLKCYRKDTPFFIAEKLR